jgi:hypothetical protein
MMSRRASAIAKTLYSVTVGVAHPFAHHAPKGSVDVPVEEQIIGQFCQNLVCFHTEAGLGSIPAGVSESRRHIGNLLALR